MGLLDKLDALNEQDHIVGHQRVYFPDQLRDQIKESGYRIIKFGGLMVKPLSNRQIETQWSEQLIDAFFSISDNFPEMCSEIYIVAEPE